MPARVRWTRRALADLDRILGYIALDNPIAAERVAAEIEERTTRLGQFPLMGRLGALPGTREFLVRRTYLVTYRVDAAQVEILQVWHTAQRRNPRDRTPP